MTNKRMRVQDVPENAILAQDVLWQRKRLVAKGSVLTKRVLDLIGRRNIQYIYIEHGAVRKQADDGYVQVDGVTPIKKQQDLSKELNVLSSIVVQGVVAPETIVDDTPDVLYHNQYLRALMELHTEMRYGRAAASERDMEFVREIFVELMQYDTYRHYLNALDEKDHYTYLHAIDVFTLSMLFMRQQGMQGCGSLSIGFLMHDIGKLHTPNAVLTKQGKLTKPEFELMKRHTVDGCNLLKQMGAEHVAYLALSHHERVDGNGYPQRLKLLDLPKEVRLLQLVDMYSAMTLTRPYSPRRSAVEAIRLLFQDKHMLDEELLNAFVDFLGIYPEHAFVLLSDGSHATVEKVQDTCPLLPTLHIFQTEEHLTLPIDFQLTIQKLITYHVETPEELFYKFSEYLINADEEGVARYYKRLKEHYKTFEWFTHVYIPVYQIFTVLQQQKVVADVCIERGKQQLAKLLAQTIRQLRQIHQQTDYALIVVDQDAVHENASMLLEGLLHTEGVYSIVIEHPGSAHELQQHLNHGSFSKVILLGDKDLPLLGMECKMDMYQLNEASLEKMLFHFASVRLSQVQVMQELAKHRHTQALIK